MKKVDPTDPHKDERFMLFNNSNIKSVVNITHLLNVKMKGYVDQITANVFYDPRKGEKSIMLMVGAGTIQMPHTYEFNNLNEVDLFVQGFVNGIAYEREVRQIREEWNFK